MPMHFEMKIITVFILKSRFPPKDLHENELNRLLIFNLVLDFLLMITCYPNLRKAYQDTTHETVEVWISNNQNAFIMFEKLWTKLVDIPINYLPNSKTLLIISLFGVRRKSYSI